MKSKELRKIIREAITDVLSEATTQKATIDYTNPTTPDKILDLDPTDTKTIAKIKTDPTIGSAAMGTKKIKESDIDEMARIPKGYRLTDDNVDTTSFTKTISGTSLADVINYFRENPGADKKALQTQFNFARPQIANAIVNGLMDAGVLTKLGAGGEEEAPGVQAQAPSATDAEDMFVGGAENPLAMYFDGEPNADGSEDMVEPEAGEIERAPMAGQLSDEDFEAFLKASTLEDRIAKVKSDILKTRRSKSGGEFETEPSTEVQRLRDLKVTLEKRLADLVAGSKYLQKRSGVEPEDIEMPDTEEPLDEWAIGRAQYYAGIKK
jgi:hypothetical protein